MGSTKMHDFARTLVSLPGAYHKHADFVLAGVLTSGAMLFGFTSLLQDTINPWIAFIGGSMGLFIAGYRIYEIIRNRGKA